MGFVVNVKKETNKIKIQNIYEERKEKPKNNFLDDWQ